MWAKHFFVLTDEKLFFTEQQDKEEEPEKEDEPEVGVVMKSHDSHVTSLTVVMWSITIDTIDRDALQGEVVPRQAAQWTDRCWEITGKLSGRKRSIPGERERYFHWRLLTLFCVSSIINY